MAKLPPMFERFLKQAEELVKKIDVLLVKLTAADNKVNKQSNKIAIFIEDLKALIRLIRAWAKGQYKDVPTKTIVWAIGAVLYFLSPFDLIPDWIPLAGYLDDEAVVAYVLYLIRGDLQNFRDWEGNNNS